jgi:hypothetical protein
VGRLVVTRRSRVGRIRRRGRRFDASLFPCGLAGFGDDDEEIEAVAGGTDEGVGGGSGEVAERGEELQQQSHGIGLAVGGKATDEAAGKAVEGGIVHCGWREKGTRVSPLRYPRIFCRDRWPRSSG